MTVLVLHTTESSSLQGSKRYLEAKNLEPNAIFDPKTGEWHQWHAGFAMGKALRNAPGGVETNRREGVWQLEIVGYASSIKSYGGDWYGNLASRLRWICNVYNIPFKFPYRFDGTRAYGLKGSVRLTAQQWRAVSGIIGHQHVPENQHWDPGPLDVDRIVRGSASAGPTTGGTAVTNGMLEVQQLLQSVGLYDGALDGVWGPKTRAGIHMMRNNYVTANEQVKVLRTQLEAALSEPKGDDAKVIGLIRQIMQEISK